MMRSKLIVLAASFVLACRSSAVARDRAPAPSPIPLDRIRDLLREDLRASGFEDAESLDRYARLFQEKVGPILQKASRSRSPYRRAFRLHRALHARLLLHYRAGADGIDSILDRGDYNCVSATLLYGMAARAIGLDAQVVESARHVFLRLSIEGREVDVECTSSDGFDLRRDVERFRRFALAYKLAGPEELDAEGPYAFFEQFHRLGAPVPLERATAFLWHNMAEKALAREETLRCALSFREVFLSYPELARRSESLAASIARAFRLEYEAGRFEAAYRIAAIEMEIFPAKTTTRDRLLAAAAKRIEAACEADEPAAAETVLDDAHAALQDVSDAARLERESCPRIAAAAVRCGDWERARRMAERFALVERDGVEGARFLEWVESRCAGALAAAERPRREEMRRNRLSPQPAVP